MISQRILVYQFGCPNSGTQKNTFQDFFFQLYFKYVEVAINDFTMHLIILKWLRIQKCKQKRKKTRQRGRSKRRNCQQKCYHSFNYIINHLSIHFFFYVNSCINLLHLFKLRSLWSSHKLIVIQIFYLNTWIF